MHDYGNHPAGEPRRLQSVRGWTSESAASNEMASVILRARGEGEGFRGWVGHKMRRRRRRRRRRRGIALLPNLALCLFHVMYDDLRIDRRSMQVHNFSMPDALSLSSPSLPAPSDRMCQKTYETELERELERERERERDQK